VKAEILRLGWPVFIGQLAVMANGVIDTVMAGHLSPVDMAAVGLGASIYITVYVGLMGVLLGLSPIVAQQYGAGAYDDIGKSFQQALWVAAVLAVPGTLALAWSSPWIAFSRPPAEVADVARIYLWASAAGLPAALLFRAFYALNTAISRPRVVMYLNLAGVAVKVPLNLVFMYGSDTLGLAPMGGAGCGVASALIAWTTALGALVWLQRDPFYAPYRLLRRALPDPARMGELLRLGLPIGAAYFVEITSFTFMALFVARFGANALASHQVASSLTGICYMGGLGIASATSTLVAQAIGAGDPVRARDTARTGLRMALALALTTGTLLWLARTPITNAYTSDAGVAAASLSLIGLVAIFHVFDSLQTQFGFILRAYKIATMPMVVYVLAMWGIGLGGGYLLTFLPDPEGPLGVFNGERSGALGFWAAGAASLVIAAAGLGGLLFRTWRRNG
jgi:MATE family multidrug resistance protein